ncbi:MAG TPA: hypothetical protein VHF02_06140 [Luteimonas sp.]|nr:hypothetical protein [Luteimonas sp.]
MTPPDIEFDPDDNFASSDGGAEFGDDDTPEALVWQLLLLINPGDEETALQQFATYRDLLADADADEAGPVWLLKDVIDWTSGFYVDEADVASFIDSVTELAARWNLRIDWGVEDATDDDFLAGTDVPTLMAVAYDRLREYGYTLWTWNTSTGAANGDTHAGWITLSRDDEAMRALAPELGIELRAGSDAF